MANKLKGNSTKNPVEKTRKTKSENLKPEKEEKINLKELARDERTWKIVGFIFLFFSFFLLISFTSYFFTWREDQPDVLNKGISILFDNNIHVSNLLGKTGALASNFFINTAFGIASFLICTFFFVVGVNLLFNRKVFSIWRNLKYVTIGLLVLSVLLHFVLSGAGGFPYGGGVGKMISNWMIGVFGTIGTAAVLIVLALGYIIWQFNPAFKMPQRKKVTDVIKPENEIAEEKIVPLTGKTINEVYAENGANGNSLKTNGGSIVLSPVNTGNYQPEFKLIEKETNESAVEMAKEKTLSITPLEETTTLLPKEEIKPAKKTSKENSEADIALEIKEFPKETVEEEETEKEKGYEDLPPYEPTLDLRDYRYPVLDLLETHGSEKIVQDANELENNKNQIIATLRNYDIEIQKIMATVGPTVTLYEIVPAAGIRISRIKNLEDDIALSLAALGIRIIAPIPGKGTIGIEVPNVRKSIVSMKTLLGSDKFQHNNYSLPIALGKKIDNDNFIVDLTSMPHLLMAGATGQGKSVGINAILVSLLYKKHPSQLKFVLIDPKKVELSLYRVIENHFLAKLPGEEEAIITDTKKVVHTLNALCIEMDNRYDLLKEAGARSIKEYNEKFVNRRFNPF